MFRARLTPVLWSTSSQVFSRAGASFNRLAGTEKEADSQGSGVAIAIHLRLSCAPLSGYCNTLGIQGIFQALGGTFVPE